MLSFPSALEIYVCTQPTDMRKFFDTLAIIITEELGQNLDSGHIFVFFNKRRNRLKLMYWDRNGYCLFYKRLEKGAFHIYDWNSNHRKSYITDSRELTMIIEGLDIFSARQHRRYRDLTA